MKQNHLVELLGYLIVERGLYRGSIGQNKLGDVLVFSYIFKVSYGIFGFHIFPKWLIKVLGHFGILFR